MERRNQGSGQIESRNDGGTDLKLETMGIIARAMFEYSLMFNLDKDGALARLFAKERPAVLDCPGSTAAFTRQICAAAGRRGLELDAVAADPIYREPPERIFDVAVETARTSLRPLLERDTWEGHEWVSKQIPFHTPSQLLEYREATYRAWLEHYRAHPDAYVPARFPDLAPFRPGRFDLILSGNCLFAYADKLFGSTPEEVYEFHRASVTRMAELLAPGGEARIFPVGTASKARYDRLDDIVAELTSLGYQVRLEPSEYKFVDKWDTLMVITAPES